VKPAAKAFADGAASAIDLMGPPRRDRPSVQAGIESYWAASGDYVRRAFDAHKAVRDLQEPLFDADALARGRDT
jgi:hypothetical protein